MKYLQAYSAAIQHQVQQLIAKDALGATLQNKYADIHEVRTDKALYFYANEIKQAFLQNAAPLNKVAYDSKIRIIQNALGTHTQIARVQGGKLKAKHEIKIAALFKQVPLALLRMIVVHELAHLKQAEHNKAFYKLCEYMEPNYHQLEFDLRLYLTYLEHNAAPLWQVDSVKTSAING